MLFHDPSCKAETTLKENNAMGMYALCQIDWVGICTKTKRGAIYMDAQSNLNGIDESVITEFLARFGAQLSDGPETQKFSMGEYNFWKIHIRNDNTYCVFSLYCRKNGIIDEENLQWLRICSEMKYAYTLLNNESIQERDLTENIVDSIEAAILVMDLARTVITCNEQSAHIFGLTAGKMLGRDFLEHVSDEWKEPFQDNFQHVVQTGERKYLNNVQLIRCNLNCVINLILSPLRDSKGRIAGAVLVGHDITELRYMEHALQQAKQFALLGEIAAGLAHDVKNPLMNINGCVRALLRNSSLDEKHQELLNLVLHESSRINDVIEQMLSFGNINAAQHQSTVDLNELLRNCVSIINRQKNGKQIEIQLVLDKDLPTIHADNGAIQQVFLNILVNSMEAIKSEGTISVSSKLLKDGRCVVTICDTGCGIPSEDLEKIFAPYYTTKADKGVSGLGLFLAKRVLNLHGASIDIDSIVGRGTRITVTFPTPESAT